MTTQHKFYHFGIVLAIVLLLPLSISAQQNRVHVMTVEGVIGPVTAEFINSELDAATNANAEALIIQLDTPGGLMTAMRSIVKTELNAETPVIMYISPKGAQCASAGVFISYAAHIFAMAPGTNVGSASPVTLGGGGATPGTEGQQDTTQSETMMKKVTNDAVAQIKSIAEQRGRNGEWAEEAVREAVNITEYEALELNVIDYISPSLDSLLAQIDGDTVEVASGETVIQTGNAQIVYREKSTRFKILDTISHPNVAYILMMLGFYGLFFELSNPGTIFPGVIGAICLILAFFAFQVLPINYAGIALIILAIILFIAETQVPSFGLLTAGGVASMVIGSIMLIDTPEPFFRVTWSVIIPVVVTTVLFFVFALGMALKAQKSKVITGVEGIVGEIGIAETPIHQSGTVAVHGETWTAVSDEPIPEGTEVRVEEVRQMKIKVSPVHNN
ncbi:MAG: nodulation protein NfeD [Candidatus Marinimicrobia bacterium]|nr:nodulation protein NfeD [Candidatus Neomarinimicrobiota bacterium]MCF7828031.1 nodulation protein NfeD [Candidatus Neomarinimicrobiota bacterium]MCF7879214.1 nodulation protein NfeD [Candidatus Neomarinimicrobiota bacterium]